MAEAEEIVVDVRRLENCTGGDVELETELAALYLETAQLYLARLRGATHDAGGWQRTAHALKGASANIGAIIVARLAAEQELAEPTLQAVRRLEVEVTAVREAFRRRGTWDPS